jgi:cell filamentation protein
MPKKKNDRYDVSALSEAQFDPGMALQAGLPLLDFGLIAGEKKETYFAAVQAGVDKNYKPMERLFAEIIERSLAAS